MVPDQELTKVDLERGLDKDCQARKLNKEDAMDRSKWRKLIKDSDDSPGPKAVKQLCVFEDLTTSNSKQPPSECSSFWLSIGIPGDISYDNCPI